MSILDELKEPYKDALKQIDYTKKCQELARQNREVKAYFKAVGTTCAGTAQMVIFGHDHILESVKVPDVKTKAVYDKEYKKDYKEEVRYYRLSPYAIALIGVEITVGVLCLLKDGWLLRQIMFYIGG